MYIALYNTCTSSMYTLIICTSLYYVCVLYVHIPCNFIVLLFKPPQYVYNTYSSDFLDEKDAANVRFDQLKKRCGLYHNSF